MMRHADRLAIGGTIYRLQDYRLQDSRVRDRDLREFRRRLPPLIALTIVLVLSGGLWALIAAVGHVVISLAF